jgi:carbamoyltransferase
MARVILGLGGLLGDPACCVLKDGEISSAVEQTKVSRQDRPGSFPNEAFQIALQIAAVKQDQIDCVAIARPFSVGPESAVQLSLRAKFPTSEIVVVEHHVAHAASSYYASGFQSASVLSIDRAGDFRSAIAFRGEGNRLTPVRELYFPDSLGDLYNRVTALLGFEPRADEHKVQWLSASGEPKYVDVFRRLLHGGGSEWPRFDRTYIDEDGGYAGLFSAKFFAELQLSPQGAIPQPVKNDIAASLQAALIEEVIRMAGDAQNVCIAGGVAFNAMLVRALEQRFQQVFVQPVAGNAGTALGAALYAWHHFNVEERRIPFQTLCLGPAYSAAEIKSILENCKLRFRFLLTEQEMIDQAVGALNDNKIVAWMQGRMEFGPRALGNRSILASPLNPYSTENLNVYIKHREAFRKFAASVPEELASEYFDVGPNARFLASIGTVKEKYRETFAAAILGSDLIRVHTVRRYENPLYHALLTAMGHSTGLPVVYNTSFNLFGDPLVCTPRDAVRSFFSSGIDTLFAGSFLLEK